MENFGVRRPVVGCIAWLDVRVIRFLNVLRELAPTIKVPLRTGISALLRSFAGVPSSVDVVVKMLNVDSELAKIILGISLHVSDKLLDGGSSLFQVPDNVWIVHEFGLII